MLILSRTIGQEIVIPINGELIRIQIVDVKGEKAKVGVAAPKAIEVWRKEIWEAMQRGERS